MNNPSLQNRIENTQGEIRLSYITPLTPQYERLVMIIQMSLGYQQPLKTDNQIVRRTKSPKSTRFSRLNIVIERSITNIKPRNERNFIRWNQVTVQCRKGVLSPNCPNYINHCYGN